MSLSKWRDSFIGAFCSDHPDSGHIVRYMAEAIGKDVFDWEDITVQKILAKIREDYGREIKDRSED